MLIDLIRDYIERFRVASSERNYAKSRQLLDRMIAELRNSPPHPSEVTTLLRETLSKAGMPGASFVFVAAWCNLSQEYVPPLCQILLSEDADLIGSHEQVVELLGELRNSTSVPALVKALDYRWDYDESFNVPRKALAALAAIGTEEALAAVMQARHSNEELIRDTAAGLLGELSSDGN